MEDPENASPSWQGWCRIQGERKWKVVVTAATERECWRKIIAYDPQAQFCEKMILQEGQHP